MPLSYSGFTGRLSLQRSTPGLSGSIFHSSILTSETKDLFKRVFFFVAFRLTFADSCGRFLAKTVQTLIY